MVDRFQGDDHITIRPWTSNVPSYFQVTVASSSSKNDGGLPYGSTVCSFDIKVSHKSGSTVNTSGLVGNSSLNGNIIMARLNYSTHLSEGIYHLDFVVTASVGGSTDVPLKKPFSFERVYVKDD